MTPDAISFAVGGVIGYLVGFFWVKTCQLREKEKLQLQQQQFPKKAKKGINWVLLVQIVLIVLIVAVMAFKASNKPEKPIKLICADNPADNETCRCVKTMVPHTRFWTGFNDTTPDLIRTMNETGRSPYSETMKVEVYGNNQTGFIMVKNLTPNYYLIYNYEVVEEKCVKAQPRKKADG